MRRYDLIVIGGGSGGVRAARVAATQGAKVLLAEESRVGGTCVIRGCVPKKLMVLASRVGMEMQDGRGFGWTFDAAGSVGRISSRTSTPSWPVLSTRTRRH